MSTGETHKQALSPGTAQPSLGTGARGARSALPVLPSLAEGSGPVKLVWGLARGLEKLAEGPVHRRAGALVEEGGGQAEGSGPRSRGYRQKGPA